MTLWDMLSCTVYYQHVRIFIANAYGNNIRVFRGTVEEARADEDTFNCLPNKVEHYEYIGGELVIMVRDENYEKKVEELYSKEAVSRWDRRDPKTRPWLYDYEISQGVWADRWERG